MNMDLIRELQTPSVAGLCRTPSTWCGFGSRVKVCLLRWGPVLSCSIGSNARCPMSKVPLL